MNRPKILPQLYSRDGVSWTEPLGPGVPNSPSPTGVATTSDSGTLLSSLQASVPRTQSDDPRPTPRFAGRVPGSMLVMRHDTLDDGRPQGRDRRTDVNEDAPYRPDRWGSGWPGRGFLGLPSSGSWVTRLVGRPDTTRSVSLLPEWRGRVGGWTGLQVGPTRTQTQRSGFGFRPTSHCALRGESVSLRRLYVRPASTPCRGGNDVCAGRVDRLVHTPSPRAGTFRGVGPGS